VFAAFKSSFLTGGTGRFFTRVPRSSIAPLGTLDPHENVVTVSAAAAELALAGEKLERPRSFDGEAAIQCDLFDNAYLTVNPVEYANDVDGLNAAQGGAR
jgi:hypothetical protein